MKNMFMISSFGIALGLVACDRDPHGARLESLADGLDLSGRCVKNCDMPPPDFLQPSKECEAAKGLTGERIICLDFNAVTATNLSDAGWKLSDASQIGCPGWDLNAGFLQVTSFSTLSNAFCVLSLPSISKNSYSSVNLVLMGAINVEAAGNGFASVTLDSPSLTRFFYQFSGSTNFGKTKISAIVTQEELASTGKTSYDFYISQNSGSNLKQSSGLRISSLAVIGN